MKVRMTTQISGTRDGADWPAPGEVVDLPADEATSYLHAGIAVAVKAEVETATVQAPENAAARRPRKGI